MAILKQLRCIRNNSNMIDMPPSDRRTEVHTLLLKKKAMKASNNNSKENRLSFHKCHNDPRLKLNNSSKLTLINKIQLLRQQLTTLSSSRQPNFLRRLKCLNNKWNLIQTNTVKNECLHFYISNRTKSGKQSTVAGRSTPAS